VRLSLRESLNGADGISDIEGKVTKVGASEPGGARVSMVEALHRYIIVVAVAAATASRPGCCRVLQGEKTCIVSGLR
jgi:hypothetical protein